MKNEDINETVNHTRRDIYCEKTNTNKIRKRYI